MNANPILSKVTNLRGAIQKRPQLTVERSIIYEPENDWTYSHHASLTFFNNRYYAIWSNGRENEDDVGQRVLISKSSDFKQWTRPAPLINTQTGIHSEQVLTAAGFHQHQGKLCAYFGAYEYTPDSLVDGHRKPGGSEHYNVSLWVVTTEDGESWTTQQDLEIPLIPNHGPEATPSGRLIISGNVCYPYTDDPSGLTGWIRTGCYDMERCADIHDDSGGFEKIRDQMGWDHAVCEGSFYAMNDGTLNMLLRGYTDYLWISQSHDDGESWSEPTETNFHDNHTKFHCGHLPDGRIFHVGTPDPFPPRRTPLAISLSIDGSHFDESYIIANDHFEMKKPGMKKKGGQFGYPHTLIHDGHMHVIVSRVKETVEVFKFPLSSLDSK